MWQMDEILEYITFGVRMDDIYYYSLTQWIKTEKQNRDQAQTIHNEWIKMKTLK